MTLYGPREFGTVTLGAAAAQRASVAGPIGPVARAVRTRVRPRGPARGVPPICARPPERQSTEVDERDAGAHQRPRSVSSVPALHHRRAVARRARVATAARRDSRPDR